MSEVRQRQHGVPATPTTTCTYRRIGEEKVAPTERHGSRTTTRMNTDSSRETQVRPEEYGMHVEIGTWPPTSNVDTTRDNATQVNKPDISRDDDVVPGESSQGTFDMWEPFWLRWQVLAAFAVGYLGLLFALILLYILSRANHGLSTTEIRHQYAWTYGPTIVLVSVAALWRQLDNTCKTLAPWKELHKGNADATTSLLLDYITPMPPVVIYRALKFRHWAVAATAVGSLAIALATSFSTGLMSLNQVTLTDLNATILVNTSFSATAYTDKLVGDAFTTYYGIIADGLRLPPGTKADMAYNVVDFDATGLNGSLITVNTSGFFPDFRCEVAAMSLAYDNTSEPTSPLYSVFLQSPTFRAQSVGGILLNNPYAAEYPARELYANAGSLLFDTSLNPDLTSDTASAWTITVAEVLYNRTVAPWLNQTAQHARDTSLNTTSWSATVSRGSAILCRPTYAIETVQVRIDTANPDSDLAVNVTGPLTSTGASLPGFNNTVLSGAIQTALRDSASLTLPARTLSEENVTKTGGASGNFWQLMTIVSGASTWEPFFEPETLRSQAENVYRGLATHVANQHLSVPVNQSIMGHRQYSEQRLEVQTLAVSFMAFAFVLLFAASILIIFQRPDKVTCRDPRTIASHAVILVGSKTLQSGLQGTGGYSDRELQASLTGVTCHSQSSECSESLQFSIYMEGPGVPRTPSSMKSRSSYRPFHISRAFIVFTSIVSLGLIVTLEGLQHRSSRPQGVTPIAVSESLANAFTTVIPAACMVFVTMQYQASHVGLSIFMPFAQLSAGTATVKNSIMQPISGELSIISIFTGMKSRNWNIVLSSCAVLISSFLSIVVSALYIVEPFQGATPGEVTATDGFTTRWNASVNTSVSDNGAGIVLGLLEHHNASYPPFTYDELVFPMFTTANSSNTSVSGGPSRLVTSLPARRASLSCAVQPTNQTTAQFYPPNRTRVTSPLVALNTNISIPTGCDWPGTYWSNQTLFLPPNGSSFAGAVVNQFWNNTDLQTDTSIRVGNAYCPSIGFLYGFIGPETSLDNVTVMVCSQMIEEVQTTTTFLFPSMQLDPASPPIVHENTTQVVEEHAIYELPEVMHSNFPIYPALDPNPISGSGLEDESPLDVFFQTILLGTDGIPPEELLGRSNEQRLLNATQHLYRKYMAQVMHANMRTPLPPSTTAPIFQVTYLNSNSLRLIQNNQSKLALQVLLGLVLILSTAAYAMTPMRNTLPHNPCTIAGTMSLLAGSEMCKRKYVPRGTEFISDKELEAVFEGYVFGMGWWEDGVQADGPGEEGDDVYGERRFGIDVIDNKIGRVTDKKAPPYEYV